MSSKRETQPGRLRLIDPKPPVAADSRRPSIARLGNELLLAVCQYLHELHPLSLAHLRLVNSNFNFLADYVAQQTVRLDFSHQGAQNTVAVLNLLERRGLLAAIRRIEVTKSEDDCACSNCANFWSHEKAGRNAGIDRFCELVRSMTGLRDVWWPLERLSSFTLACLPRRVRLHMSTPEPVWKSRCALGGLLDILVGNPNLHSLGVKHVYTNDPKSCSNVTEPLKKVLLSALNLRNLTLDICLSHGGIMYYEPSEYCGLGFVDGERPAALERLNLIAYPFGRLDQGLPDQATLPHHSGGLPLSVGFPGAVDEVEYWRDTFDWSRLKKFNCEKPAITHVLLPKLLKLENITVGPGSGSIHEQHVASFPSKSPVALRSIKVPTLAFITLNGILRHGEGLKRLEMHRKEDFKGSWRETAIDNASLTAIRDGCPLIEELRVDIGRVGNDWPHTTLDILASFPRLRHLTIWFELGRPADKLVQPLVTVSSVEMLFRYLRARSPTGPSQLRELHVYSGAPPDVLGGYLTQLAFWPRYNSVHFSCTPAVRDDAAAEGKLLVECPEARREVNEFIRGERQSVDWQPHEQELVNVALNGPKAYKDWNAHY